MGISGNVIHPPQSRGTITITSAYFLLKYYYKIAVGRLEGAPPNPEMLVQRLSNVVRDNEAFIVAARADRAERHMTQTIRQEQDAALQDALRQDQEKERKKREVEEEKRRVEEEEITSTIFAGNL